jgi:hypothetical protein
VAAATRHRSRPWLLRLVIAPARGCCDSSSLPPVAAATRHRSRPPPPRRCWQDDEDALKAVLPPPPPPPPPTSASAASAAPPAALTASAAAGVLLLPAFSRERNARLLLAGEKRVLHALLQLSGAGRELLCPRLAGVEGASEYGAAGTLAADSESSDAWGGGDPEFECAPLEYAAACGLAAAQAAAQPRGRDAALSRYVTSVVLPLIKQAEQMSDHLDHLDS